MENYVKERDEAFRSLDKNKIIAYCKKYEVKIPKDERAFWGGVHKARLASLGMTEEEKEISRKWLKENGFQEGVF